MRKSAGEYCVGRVISVKQAFFLLGLSICLLFSMCLAPVQAAGIIRETVPLERNGVPLHLERYT